MKLPTFHLSGNENWRNCRICVRETPRLVTEQERDSPKPNFRLSLMHYKIIFFWDKFEKAGLL